MRAPRAHLRGFTMLEALVASGVLAIGIVGIVGLQAALFHSARFSQDMSNAAYILQHRTEELSTMSVAALDGPPAICAGAAPGCLGAGGGYAGAPASGCSQRVLDPKSVFDASPAPASAPYRIDTGILPHADPNHPNARIATVSVCWTENNGRVRQIRSVRVLGDR